MENTLWNSTYTYVDNVDPKFLRYLISIGSHPVVKVLINDSVLTRKGWWRVALTDNDIYKYPRLDVLDIQIVPENERIYFDFYPPFMYYEIYTINSSR